MRAFVLQPSNKYDVSAAEAYGKIVYLIDEYLPPFDPDETIRRMRTRLKQLEFDPKEDAMVLTGASILVSVFLSVLTYDYKKIKTLLFDARTGKYKLVTMEM